MISFHFILTKFWTFYVFDQLIKYPNMFLFIFIWFGCPSPLISCHDDWKNATKTKKSKKCLALLKVPTAPPENVRAEPEDSSSVRVMWSPPPVDKQNGHISHYKLYYVEASRPDKEAIEMMLKSPLQDGTEFKLEELKKWTQYRIWLLAGTVVGDGPPSESITVRTQEDGTYLFLDSGPAPTLSLSPPTYCDGVYLPLRLAYLYSNMPVCFFFFGSLISRALWTTTRATKTC